MIRTITLFLALLCARSTFAEIGNPSSESFLECSAADFSSSDEFQVGDVVAEVRFVSIFLVRAFPLTRGVRILRDGRVYSYVRSGFGSESKFLSPLSPSLLEELLARVEAIKPGSLVDENPGSPVCRTTGSEYFVVTPSQKEPIIIHKNASCHRFDIQQPGSEWIQKLLQEVGK